MRKELSGRTARIRDEPELDRAAKRTGMGFQKLSAKENKKGKKETASPRQA